MQLDVKTFSAHSCEFHLLPSNDKALGNGGGTRGEKAGLSPE